MRRLHLIFGLSCALLAAPAAEAQVLEIGDGGVVTVRSGPAVTTAGGVTPLIVAAPVAATGGSVELEIVEAARAHHVDARLVRAVALQESGLRQTARSAKGARGVMQLMPATARDLGVDAADLHGNIQGGAAYLGRMLDRFGGNARLALAAYNAGPGAVLRYGGTPPFAETQAYVRRVLALASTTPAFPLTGPTP